jgi:integrase
MTPRTASLRVAHQASCPNATKTALTSVGRGSGCKCEPSFYTFHRNRDGKPEKGARIKTRQVADRALRKLKVEIDEKRVGQSRPKELTFNEWADDYETIIEGRIRAGDLKPKTLRAYKETLALARLEFGTTWLRELGQSELRGFYGRIESQKPASRLRHLRQLSACLTVAVDEGKSYLEINPVPAFIKKQRLKAPKRGKAPFEDGELERLWTAYKSYEPVYGYVSRFSAESGARLGELVALDWSNVDLSNDRVYIEHTWDDEAGPVAPKDNEPRWLYLTPYAVKVLEEWVAVVGARASGPVFTNPVGGGRLVARQVQRRLTNAMEDAGVVKMQPDLRLPRSFHSFRYSFSGLSQRRGYDPRFIEQTLGHSTLELSYGVYGGWTPDQLAAEAARESD